MSRNTNSRCCDSARGRNADGSDGRMPPRKVNATRQATIPRQDVVLITPPKYCKGPTRITPLDGLGEVGRSMSVVEYSGYLLLIDCGVLSPEGGQSGAGLILPGLSYIRSRLDKVGALVLTHGHEDHTGDVPYLLRLCSDIPLIDSKLTPASMDARCKEHRQNFTKAEAAGREKLRVGPFDFELVNVTHSTLDVPAVYIKTPVGSLTDTGDIRLDQLSLDRHITSLVEFGKIGERGVGPLMMDSTNAEAPGFVEPETSIGPTLDQTSTQVTRKIIVASFSSHAHRVQQVVNAAHKYGCKVAFAGCLMVRNISIAVDLDYPHVLEGTTVDLKQADDIQDDRLASICTGSQGEPTAALGHIAGDNHRDIRVNEPDVVILASSLVPGNEYGAYRVINKPVRLGARVVDRDNAAVHVSGHYNEGELLYMCNIIKPKCAMPVHGENHHLVTSGLIAVKTDVDPQNMVLAEDSDVVDLYHGRAAVAGPVSCGYVYVDGDSASELTGNELERRRILSTEGFVSVFVVVGTDNHEVVTSPKIYLNAVVEDESKFDKVCHQIVEQFNDQTMRGTRDIYELQQTIRRTLGSQVARQLHREPMIVPVVADIAQDVETVETRQPGLSRDNRKE